MISRMLAASLTTFVFFTPGPTVPQAQGSDVTFSVPLNLTHLLPDLAKVEVYCTISSSAIPQYGGIGHALLKGQQDIVVSGGQVVTTATVVVAVNGLINPVGQTAHYDCKLSGFSTSLQTWGSLDPFSTTMAFRVSPATAPLSGSFTW
jgi:hypothetical protein